MWVCTSDVDTVSVVDLVTLVFDCYGGYQTCNFYKVLRGMKIGLSLLFRMQDGNISGKQDEVRSKLTCKSN
jgi:hypothetical protein